MKAFSKMGLLVAMALLAIAAVASSAQAVSFNPDNTPVSGVSSNFNLSHGGASLTCDNATWDGTTGLDSGSIDVALTFSDCAIGGSSPASMDCAGDVTLNADEDGDDTGDIELPDGFECSITTALCTITLAGPQTSQPKSWFLDETNDIWSVAAEFAATRTGSVLCGPASGIATFQGDYDTTPSNLTIDP